MYRKTVLELSALEGKDKGWALWGDLYLGIKSVKVVTKQNGQISYRPKGKI